MEKRKSKKRTPLVIDSNILIASLRSRALTRKLLLYKQIATHFELMTLDFCFGEVWNYRDRWNIRNLSDLELIKILDFFFKQRIKIIKTSEVKAELNNAYKIMKNFDEKDTPILALALHTQGIIWSNDKNLKKQEIVKTLTTSELKKVLKIE